MKTFDLKRLKAGKFVFVHNEEDLRQLRRTARREGFAVWITRIRTGWKVERSQQPEFNLKETI